MQALSRAIAAAPAARSAVRAAVAGVAGLPSASCREVVALSKAVSAVRWYSRTAVCSAPGTPQGSQLSGTARAKLEKEKRAKKRRAKNLQFKVRNGPVFHIDEALRLVRAHATCSFDETVDIQIQLAVDPRKPGQNVRGVAQLPAGSGKPVSIAVFAKGEKAEEARRAGATFVGAEDLVDKIIKGEVPLTFNKTIATPDTMGALGKVARLLGPRGLMPNPKLGTVTTNIKDAVAAAKRGQAEFRVEKKGIVSAGVGKVSFSTDSLRDNLRAFILAVSDTRPEGVKGNYMRWCILRSTMGPGIPVDMTCVDPQSPRFMEPQGTLLPGTGTLATTTAATATGSSATRTTIAQAAPLAGGGAAASSTGAEAALA